MTTKEQAFAMLEGRIDTIQSLCKECIDMLYKTAYNEAINDAIKIIEMRVGGGTLNELSKLKK